MTYLHPKFPFYATHLETDGSLLKVWGQTEFKATTSFETIIRNLRKDFLRGVGSITPNRKLFLNIICCAYYEDTYYRAKICGINYPSRTVLVQFIDYGNVESVPFTSIRLLPNDTEDGIELQTKPGAARYFTIANVLPFESKKWDPKVVEQIKCTLLFKDYLASIVFATEDQRMINIFLKNKNFSDYLVQKQLARQSSDLEMINASMKMYRSMSRNSRVYVSNGNTAILPSTTTSSGRGGKQTQSIPKRVEVLANKRKLDSRSAFISNINSPGEFWIHQEKFVPELELIADCLMVADMLPNLNKIKAGELCVAKYPEDGMWYRARIISHGDRGTNIIYIDYGNSAVSTDIRVIPSDLAEIPPLSKKCYLPLPNGIDQWSYESSQEFIKMVNYGATKFHLDILEEGNEISKVKLTLDGKNIVEQLVRLCKVLPPVIEKRLSPIAEKNSQNVFISNVFSPAEFSIQAECKIPDLEIMAVHLEKASSFLPLKTFKKKTICAAQFPEDGLWYRAEILCHSKSETEVLYIDYGNTAITNQLRALPENIINIPPLSRSCSLVMPKNIKAWSEKACKKFFELVADGQTMFQYKQLDDKSPCHISLSIDNQDILEILIPLCTEIKSTKVNAEITAKNDNHDGASQCNSSNTSSVGPPEVSSDASACELQINENLVVDCSIQTEYSISQDITKIIEQSGISEINVKQSEDKKDFQKQEETANETAPHVINKEKNGEKEAVQLLTTDVPNTEIDQIENSQVVAIETVSEINEKKENSNEEVQSVKTLVPSTEIDQIEKLQVAVFKTVSETNEEKKSSNEEVLQQLKNTN